jgi:hypothetical protein
MLKSTTFAIVLGAAFLASDGAFAFEGRYVAGDKAYRQELEIKKRADGGFELTAVVGMDGCSGYVDARGASNGDTLRAESLEDKTCVLAISRTKKGVRVQPENCESFHGPSCDFEGDYRKRR